jgi:hypothetical protein
VETLFDAALRASAQKSFEFEGLWQEFPMKQGKMT